MKLRKSYSFLYVPDDHSGVKPFQLRRWVALALAGAGVALLLLSIAYVAGLPEGASWRPGGSPLAVENQMLRHQVDHLNGKVADLRGSLDEVYQLQGILAEAVDLEPIDPETYRAGIGGRGPLASTAADLELSGLKDALPTEGVRELDFEIDQLLRQARIQRQGFEAILDTLATRSIQRQHVPSIRPCDAGWLSSRFGMRKDPFTEKQTFHRGIDYSLPVGSPVRVTGDGVVAVVQRQRGLGKVLKIDHGHGVVTVYAHLNKILVEKGQQVQRGDIVAESGNTGRSTAPHLHYEIHINNRAVNPLAHILDSYADRN
jgi:murein DD-endopeptidase MepM/ murein hydrolase activator NlpD